MCLFAAAAAGNFLSCVSPHYIPTVAPWETFSAIKRETNAALWSQIRGNQLRLPTKSWKHTHTHVHTCAHTHAHAHTVASHGKHVKYLIRRPFRPGNKQNPAQHFCDRRNHLFGRTLSTDGEQLEFILWVREKFCLLIILMKFQVIKDDLEDFLNLLASSPVNAPTDTAVTNKQLAGLNN